MKRAPIIIGEDVQNDAEVRTIFHSSSRLPVLSALKLVIAILIIYLTVYFVWIEALSLDYFSIKMMTLFSFKDSSFSVQNNINGRDVLILFSTKYFDNVGFVDDGSERFDFVGTNAKGMFEKCPPPANRCRLINNRSLVQQSEAVIFHARDLETIKWPEFRSPEQRWIFWNLEPPHHTRNEQLLKHLPPRFHFNWTLTYRKDSDVFMPYSPSAKEYRRRLALESGRINSSLLTAIQNKTKLVAWIVSNCQAKSGRNAYVKELKKHINVDVFGECGQLKCDDKNNAYACYEMLERDYKFYLSFENSLCRDYVTEKFYNSLLFSTVPIVYGGADYESVGAPSNSYIDVRNFTSAQHLANYLHFLDKNETAYRSYFDWRLKPPGLASLRLQEPWCNLCLKLMTENKVKDDAITDNENKSFPVTATTRRSYADIYSWWFTNSSCQSQINPL